MSLRRLLLVAVLCAGCASTGAGAGVSGATPATGLGARQLAAALGSAQQAMFDNRYGDADAAYARLLASNPGSAQAHAAFALFLAYRSELEPALGEAEQAVHLDARSAAAQAALCRVSDWNGDIAGALRAGRLAVSLDSRDPLARLFLSEALADSGDQPSSRTQIDAASRLIDAAPTAYLRAEAFRETANLQAAAGDASGQIDSLQQARTMQSRWLYRTSELVSAQVVSGRRDAARQTLDSVTAQAPADVEALQALGDDAIFVGAGPAASNLWSRALGLDPTDSRILDVNGDLAVAVKNDINTAVTLFQRALVADPTDGEAAAYLLALARYVQHQPALGTDEIAAAVARDIAARPRHLPYLPQPDALIAQAAKRALLTVNGARAVAGLPAVALDPRLSQSATSHSFYWLFNSFSGTVDGLGIHQETPGLTGYSARYPWTRALAFGYPDERIGEDVTHRGEPAAAVRDWINSVYHRFSILRPDLRVVGYGQAELGSLFMEDMEFGFGPASSATPVLYPSAGQTSVPTTFVDNEVPDPVPAGGPRDTGYPVTVTFSLADFVSMSSFTLTGPAGTPLDAYVLRPGSDTENSASLLPVRPLLAATAYTAHIVATVAGRPFDRTWTFTTNG